MARTPHRWQVGHVISLPVPQTAVCSAKKGLLLHVVDGQFTGQVGLPPDCLVAVQREKKNQIKREKKIHVKKVNVYNERVNEIN